MKSREYWQARFTALEAAQHKRGAECYAEIEREYNKALREIERDILAWYQRFADNNKITMAEARRLLTSRELKELKWDVNEYIKAGEENAVNGRWMKELENASARVHIGRLEAIKLQMQQHVETLFGNQLDAIDRTMRDTYTKDYYHTAYEVQKGVGVGATFATLDEASVERVIKKPWAADGRDFSERVWGNRTKLVNELHTALTQNIIRGQDPQKAINEIAKRMNVSKHAAGRLVMTESAFFGSAGRFASLKALGVEEFEIVATLDTHTSNICRQLDGKHFPLKEWNIGVTAPPFHVYCRSTAAPYFDDDESVRAARDENGKEIYVPEGMTYEDWEKVFVKKEMDLATWNKNHRANIAANTVLQAPAQYGQKVINLRAEIDRLNKALAVNWTVADDAALKNTRKDLTDTLIAAAKDGEIFTTGFEKNKNFDKAHLDAIKRCVENADENFRIVWNRFEADMKALDINTPRGNYYDPAYNRCGICVNLPNDTIRRYGRPNYISTFHETGHMIDHLVEHQRAWGSHFFNGGEFADTIRREVEAVIKARLDDIKRQAVLNGINPKTCKKADAYASISKELRALSHEEGAEISDIFCGATKHKAFGNWHHDAAYWKDPKALSLEAFAEMFAATMVNPKSIAQIKAYLPQSYDVFLKMIDEIAKNGRF